MSDRSDNDDKEKILKTLNDIIKFINTRQEMISNFTKYAEDLTTHPENLPNVLVDIRSNIDSYKNAFTNCNTSMSEMQKIKFNDV